MKKQWLVMLAVAIAVGFAGQAFAFHDGGVADCSGCHSMHSAAGLNLLVAGNPSETCLSCHENASGGSYHISTAASALAAGTDIVKNFTPGGDFGWLRQDFAAPASYGNGYVIINNVGWERGHNIQAAANGYTVTDNFNGQPDSPGGSFPAGNLGCNNCHDPHGQARIIDTGTGIEVECPTINDTHDPIFHSGSYTGNLPHPGEAVGTYRLLYGDCATGDSNIFDGVPLARVASSYNRTETKADPTRVAYGYGTGNGFVAWDEWCAECHAGMHEDTPGPQATGGVVHPTSATLGAEATNYNAYVMTGDLTGTDADSFTSLVPYTTSIADLEILDIVEAGNGGPAAGGRMNCLTCHRAHASGWKYALRWNNEAEFLTLGDTTTGAIYPGEELAGTIGNQGQFNRGMTSLQMAAAYNGRVATDEFAPHQRVLCNKCHIKD